MKRVIFKGIFVLGIGLLASQIAQAQGNLIFNANFDTSTTGWALTNVFGSGYEPTHGNPPGDLLLAGLASSPSTANQIITSLTPGTIYVISGDFRRAGGKHFTDFTFGVAFDGFFLFEPTDPGNFNWQSFSFDYTATSSSALLSLSSQLNGSDYIFAIDNISMQPIPEPSVSELLLSFGGTLLLGFGRWKTKAVQ